MRHDIIAEVTLTEAEGPPSSVSSFGVITTFGQDSFSAAIVAPSTPNGLTAGEPRKVHLKFLFPESALKSATVGSTFSFSDQGRRGVGRVVARNDTEDGRSPTRA
jgi:hypothetical protein